MNDLLASQTLGAFLRPDDQASLELNVLTSQDFFLGYFPRLLTAVVLSARSTWRAAKDRSATALPPTKTARPLRSAP
ncbi:hypothetical protein D3C71_701210 [compost metagenome]